MSKRKAYSVKEKLEFIAKVKSGVSIQNIYKEYDIPPGTMRGWMVYEEKFKSYLDKLDPNVGLARKKARFGNNQDIDDCLYKWYTQQRSKGIHVSINDLRSQAEKIYLSLKGAGDFKVSVGWLCRWQKRHGVRYKPSGGSKEKSNSSKHVVENNFSKRFSSFIMDEGYTNVQVYNCDETALCYNMLPKSTDLDVSQNAGLNSKEKLIVLFCVNKAGNHKLKPLIICKKQSQLCSKSINKKSLPVTYRSSTEAWMTTDIFHDWFHNSFIPSVRKFLTESHLEPKALLLLDNCPAHPPAENLVSDDGKIKVIYLPKHANNHMQPIDQGIISAFKTNYRTEMIKSLLASDIKARIFLENMDLKDVSYRIALAWQAITSETIINCWKKFMESNIVDSKTKNQSDIASGNILSESELARIRKILKDPEITNDSVANWFEADDTEGTCETMTNQMIVKTICPDVPCKEEPRDEKGIVIVKPTIEEAIDAMNTVIRWAEYEYDIDSANLMQLESFKMLMMQKLSESKQIDESNKC